MHKVCIPDHVVARAASCAAEKSTCSIRSTWPRVAHVIVDLQVGFVAEGAPVEVPRPARSSARSTDFPGGARRWRPQRLSSLHLRRSGKLPWNVWFGQLHVGGPFCDEAQRVFARRPLLAARARTRSEGRRPHHRQDPLFGPDPRHLRHGCAIEGARDRHAHHHRHADELLLREHGPRRAADGLQRDFPDRRQRRR